MSISRPRSPKAPATRAASAARVSKAATSTTSSAPAPKAGGWSPRSAPRRPLELRLPPLADPGGAAAALRTTPAQKALAPAAVPLDTPVQQALVASIDRYTAQVQAALHHDAKSLASGQAPVLAGDTLSADQLAQLQSASLDFLKGLPVGALAPQAVARLTDQLAAKGVDTTDLASRPLGALGDTGHAFAQELLSQLRSGDAPTQAYALAGTLAAVAGYSAWTQGSQGLAALGFRPEFQRSLFDDRLQVKAGAGWQAELKDFSVSASATGKQELGRAGTLAASGAVSTKNGFEGGSVGWSVERPNWNLAATAALSKKGLDSVALSGQRTGSLGQVNVGATLDANGKLTAAAFGAALEKGAYSAKLAATLDAAGATQGDVSLGRKTDAASQQLAVHVQDGRVDQATAQLSATCADGPRVDLSVAHEVKTNTTTLGAKQRFLIGTGALETQATVDANAGLTAASAAYSRTSGRFSVDAKASLNSDGFDQASLSAKERSDAGTLEATVTANAQGFKSGGLEATYAPDANLSLTAGVARDFQDQRTTGHLEATWTDGKDAALSVNGSADSQGQSGLGVRLDVKF